MPYERSNLAAMASRSDRAPQVTAYWFTSAVIAWRGDYRLAFAVLLIPGALTILMLLVARARFPQPEDLTNPEVGPQAVLDLGARQRRIAIGVEQALPRRQHGPLARLDPTDVRTEGLVVADGHRLPVVARRPHAREPVLAPERRVGVLTQQGQKDLPLALLRVLRGVPEPRVLAPLAEAERHRQQRPHERAPNSTT